jgi:hypothetical protein
MRLGMRRLVPHWNLVRLELARTPHFPEGSASRSYLLRVPLDDAGMIDDAAITERPARATVRRFWPNEPDQSGYLLRTDKGWAFSYALGQDEQESVCHLERHALRPGECVIVRECDGDELPFRVAASQPDGAEGA